MSAHTMAKILPSVEELRAIFDYDSESGILTWKPRTTGMRIAGRPIPNSVRFGNWNIQHAGRAAGGVGNRGYLQVGICGGRFLVHRVIWAISNGYWPVDQIDHVNGNKADNRLCNLRAANNQQNSKNQARSKNNTSGVTGVGWHKRSRKWSAYIQVGGRQRSLGEYHNLNDAIAARKSAERVEQFHENHGRKPL